MLCFNSNCNEDQRMEFLVTKEVVLTVNLVFFVWQIRLKLRDYLCLKMFNFRRNTILIFPTVYVISYLTSLESATRVNLFKRQFTDTAPKPSFAKSWNVIESSKISSNYIYKTLANWKNGSVSLSWNYYSVSYKRRFMQKVMVV